MNNEMCVIGSVSQHRGAFQGLLRSSSELHVVRGRCVSLTHIQPTMCFCAMPVSRGTVIQPDSAYRGFRTVHRRNLVFNQRY